MCCKVFNPLSVNKKLPQKTLDKKKKKTQLKQSQKKQKHYMNHRIKTD